MVFRYSYRMGHILSSGSYIWSKTYSFKSSPYPGQDSLQRVIIFGDLGKVKQTQNNKQQKIKIERSIHL